MRTRTQASWLPLLTVVCLFAARPCSAQPDCTAFAHDPLPDLAPSAGNSKRLTDCAYLLTNQGDYRRAQTLFEKALQMSALRADPPSRAIALAGLGLTLGTLGQPEQAEKAL